MIDTIRMRKPSRFILRLALPILYLLIGLGNLTGVEGQAARSGIQFQLGDFNQALALAKATHKPLCVEVYLTGCPHCQALAPILKEKRVGDFFNANFVNWQVEANAPASAAFQKSRQITYPEFPLLLFFDPTGNLIHVATPAEQSPQAAFIDQVINIGRTALDPAQRTSSYAARFEAGERDVSFLINYGKYGKVRKDNARLQTIGDALGQALTQPEDIKSPVGFYCLQRLINDVDNPMAVYFFTHLGEFTASFPAKDVKDAGEGLIYRSLYGSKGDQYSVHQIERMRDYMVRLGVPANEAAARTLLKELDAHLRAGHTPAAVQRFNDYRRQVPSLGVADYAYLLHYFNEKATDKSYLTEVAGWAADGLKGVKPGEQNTKPVADLYYELAVAEGKMGQQAEALRAAQKGLETAKAAKVETKRHEAQLSLLK